MKLADKVYDVYEIPLIQIWADDSWNCRMSITRESVEELAASIKQDGLIFPIGVQPIEDVEDAPQGFRYRLIWGYRRFLALRMLGAQTAPAHLREGLTERQAQLMNLTENLERKDLNILEEARAIDRLFPAYRSKKSIAEELKKSTKWVDVRRKLLELSEEIQLAAASGRLTDRDLQTIQHALDPDLKAKEILQAAKEGRKSEVLYNGRHVRKKSEVQDLITMLLAEGFNPEFLRLLGWTIGQVDQAGLDKSLAWIRDRKGWLK